MAKKSSKATKTTKHANAHLPAAPDASASNEAAPEKAKPEPKTQKARAKRQPKEKKMSALDAAAKVLGETREAMSTSEMIEAMATKGYWSSPGGKTPGATLYSAILRECTVKGKESRFTKTERGKFALRS